MAIVVPSQKQVDSFIVHGDVVRVNAETHHKLGLKPKIIRRTSGSCCAWCDALAGVYAYPEVPRDVYRRHRYCRCTVEYAPDGKRRQNVHTKKWQRNQNTTANLPDISQVESRTALNIIDRLNANDVTYNPVTKLPRPLSTKEIVQRLAGGDETGGSCSSVAFCYIGNKHGLDVLDFRGGKSLDEFSSDRAIEAISKLPNIKGSIIKVKKEVQGTMEVLKNLEFGKEYYLAAGEHAAIVRKAEEGLQFLELQASEEDEEENGWTSFDFYGSVEETLERRFGCKTSADRKFGIVQKKEVFLMDVASFQGNRDFETLLGYMNTNVNEQKNGAGGHVR